MPNSTILLAWDTCYNYESKLSNPNEADVHSFCRERIVSNAEFGVRLCDIELSYFPNNQLVKNYKSVFERLLKLYGSN